MFLIGNFASHLPYLILGILYVISMGSYSLHAVQVKHSEPVAEPVALVYINTASSQIHDTKTYYYQVPSQKLYPETFQTMPIRFRQTGISHCWSEYESSYISKPFRYSLFSRPPPIV